MDGRQVIKAKRSGTVEEVRELGESVAQEDTHRGGAEILKDIKSLKLQV